MVWGIVAVLGVALAVALVFLLRRKPEPAAFQLLQQQLANLQDGILRQLTELRTSTGTDINRLNEKVDERLKNTSDLVAGTHRTVGDRLDRNTQVMSHVQERLIKLEEANKQIQAIGSEIAKLHDILRVPKLRGNLGELFLEELLSQILPRDYFEMQYRFRSGLTVDAVIKLAQGHLVPVDAKFPLENFQRMLGSNLSEAEQKNFRRAFASDFRKHVDQIASKYILPDEGTLDFALLYVPAENIYYETILRDDQFGSDSGMNAYALKKRVIPVSPNSLYAYLQAIVLGLRGLKIQERAEEILQFLTRVHSELDRMKDEFALVGKHLGNASGTLEKGQKRLERLDEKILDIEQSSLQTKAISEDISADPAPSVPVVTRNG